MLPDHGFIGCEPFINGVAAALAHIRDQHLANVRIWRGDALDVLRRVPDGALSFVYLLHPDPWPKARHAKRRMINDGPLELIAAKLKPGGELRVATDHPTYLEWALMVMQRHRRAASNGWRRSRRISSSRRAAGSKPATAPSPAARAAGLIICATAAPERGLEPQQPSPAVLEQIDLAARALLDRADARAHRPLIGLAGTGRRRCRRGCSASPDSAPISASPFHCGNRSPE